jgi:hypothetical protein
VGQESLRGSQGLGELSNLARGRACHLRVVNRLLICQGSHALRSRRLFSGQDWKSRFQNALQSLVYLFPGSNDGRQPVGLPFGMGTG